ncbi:MAG: SRPBCC family protein [Candidatus Hodarchaeales archaeon]|jgi:uncharacterized protein YndB with AHSA1/START domain
MPFQDNPDVIKWKIHLKSPPESVYEFLSTDRGRKTFWAKTKEKREKIRFEFPNSYLFEGKILLKNPPSQFSVEYIGGSHVCFSLTPDGRGGTDLEVTDVNVPGEHRTEVIAGWGSVLMALKGVADFGVDLRNHDPTRTWDQGYFDN